MEPPDLQPKPTTLSRSFHEEIHGDRSVAVHIPHFHSPRQVRTPLKIFQVTRGRSHLIQEDLIFSENRGETLQAKESKSKLKFGSPPSAAVPKLRILMLEGGIEGDRPRSASRSSGTNIFQVKQRYTPSQSSDKQAELRDWQLNNNARNLNSMLGDQNQPKSVIPRLDLSGVSAPTQCDKTGQSLKTSNSKSIPVDEHGPGKISSGQKLQIDYSQPSRGFFIKKPASHMGSPIQQPVSPQIRGAPTSKANATILSIKEGNYSNFRRKSQSLEVSSPSTVLKHYFKGPEEPKPAEWDRNSQQTCKLRVDFSTARSTSRQRASSTKLSQEQCVTKGLPNSRPSLMLSTSRNQMIGMPRSRDKLGRTGLKSLPSEATSNMI